MDSTSFVIVDKGREKVYLFYRDKLLAFSTTNKYIYKMYYIYISKASVLKSN